MSKPDPFTTNGMGVMRPGSPRAIYRPDDGYRIGSAAGAIGSRGTPTSVRGRMEKAARLGADRDEAMTAGYLPTVQAKGVLDVMQNNFDARTALPAQESNDMAYLGAGSAANRVNRIMAPQPSIYRSAADAGAATQAAAQVPPVAATAVTPPATTAVTPPAATAATAAAPTAPAVQSVTPPAQRSQQDLMQQYGSHIENGREVANTPEANLMLAGEAGRNRLIEQGKLQTRGDTFARAMESLAARQRAGTAGPAQGFRPDLGGKVSMTGGQLIDPMNLPKPSTGLINGIPADQAIRGAMQAQADTMMYPGTEKNQGSVNPMYGKTTAYKGYPVFPQAIQSQDAIWNENNEYVGSRGLMDRQLPQLNTSAQGVIDPRNVMRLPYTQMEPSKVDFRALAAQAAAANTAQVGAPSAKAAAASPNAPSPASAPPLMTSQMPSDDLRKLSVGEKEAKFALGTLPAPWLPQKAAPVDFSAQYDPRSNSQMKFLNDSYNPQLGDSDLSTMDLLKALGLGVKDRAVRKADSIWDSIFAKESQKKKTKNYAPVL